MLPVTEKQIFGKEVLFVVLTYHYSHPYYGWNILFLLLTEILDVVSFDDVSL